MIVYLCRVLGHRRSKRMARPFEATWRSQCTICGSRLERIEPGKWRELNGEQTRRAA